MLDAELETVRAITGRKYTLLRCAMVGFAAYALPFPLDTQSPWTLLVIVDTHVVIDRFRLDRQAIWFKILLTSRGRNPP